MHQTLHLLNCTKYTWSCTFLRCQSAFFTHCREQSNELATSSSKSSHGSGRADSSSQAGQPAAAPDTQGSADEAPQAKEGVPQQEQENIGAEEPEEGKTETRPLPWLTWLAQKLYAQVAPCTCCSQSVLKLFWHE